jgi:hypothetical protein
MLIDLVQLIHNPGSVPDSRFANPGPDVTIVTENSCELYESPYIQELLAVEPYDREHSCIIVHTTPPEKLVPVVEAVRAQAAHVFVTDLTSNFYESFGPSWGQFVELLHRL